MNTENDISKLHEENAQLKSVLEETRATLASLLGMMVTPGTVPAEPIRPLLLEPEPTTDQLEAMLDFEGIGILSIDPAAGSVIVSPRFRELLGTGEKVPLELFLSRICEEDRDDFSGALACIQKADGEGCGIVRIRLIDGTERKMRYRLRAWYKKTRKKQSVSFITGILLEVPDVPKETGHAASGIEESFSAVVEGLIFYDANGKIIRMNGAAEKILLDGKNDHDTPFGRQLANLTITKADGTLLRQEESPAYRALKGETIRNLVLALSRKKNRDVNWVSVNSAPVRNGAGEITGAVSSIVDITELIQAEEAIRNAKEEADRANTAKSEFLAHMSHEIRTPIGGILGLTDVLRSRVRNGEDLSFLKMISDSARSLLGIIGDILDLSRIESGKMELSSLEFNLRDELRTLVSTFSIPAGEKGLTLGLTISEDIPEMLLGDPERLRQVVRNLLSNAIKYTEHGRISVTIEPKTREGKKLEIQCTVTDTGIGIPEDRQHLLFREFVRLENVYSKKEGQGAGLGLAISKHLVTMMGGTIHVESTPGKGSAFVFTICLTTIDMRQESVPDTVARENELSELPHLRMLVAEDNRINQLFLKAVLEQAGHEVTTADNGREAVEAALSSAHGGQGFDTILMDIQMPEMNGIEAMKAIRAAGEPVSQTAIIALTAFAMKGDETKFLEAGMDGYVTKPVDFTRLARELRRVCLGK